MLLVRGMTIGEVEKIIIGSATVAILVYCYTLLIGIDSFYEMSMQSGREVNEDMVSLGSSGSDFRGVRMRCPIIAIILLLIYSGAKVRFDVNYGRRIGYAGLAVFCLALIIHYMPRMLIASRLYHCSLLSYYRLLSRSSIL